jgi:hypothetical protein
VPPSGQKPQVAIGDDLNSEGCLFVDLSLSLGLEQERQMRRRSQVCTCCSGRIRCVVDHLGIHVASHQTDSRPSTVRSYQILLSMLIYFEPHGGIGTPQQLVEFT